MMRTTLLAAIVALAICFDSKSEENPNSPGEWQLKAVTLKSGAVMKALVLDKDGAPIYIDDGAGPMDFSRNSVVKIEEIPEKEQESLRAEIDKRRANATAKRSARKAPEKPTTEPHTIESIIDNLTIE